MIKIYFPLGKKFKCMVDNLPCFVKGDVFEVFDVDLFETVLYCRMKRLDNYIGTIDLLLFENLLKSNKFILVGSINKKVNLNKESNFKRFIEKEKTIILNSSLIK